MICPTCHDEADKALAGKEQYEGNPKGNVKVCHSNEATFIHIEKMDEAE